MRYRGYLLAIVLLVASGCPFLRPHERLRFEGVVVSYSSPYLLDFTFSLRDKDGHAINNDPSSFTIKAMENGEAISSTETAFLLARGLTKQLKCFLVLDYTNSMVSAGAIDAMEESAKAFIDGLAPDAQVGIFEFHRDSPPQKVSSLATYKPYLKDRIDAIWTEFVQDFPGASRCWDAVYAAVQELGGPSADEGRYVVFLSDGRDESSRHSPDDIIDAAVRNGVAIYCIGFGAELRPADLRHITSETDGGYYGSASVAELQDRFEQITQDLGSQYTLRWATLKRSSQSFTPSFEISLEGQSATYTGPSYSPTDYAGNPFQGELRIPEYNIVFGTASIFLRAVYVPRYIRELRMYARSSYPFVITLVSAEDGGLCAGWEGPTITEDAKSGGAWIELVSPDPDDLGTSIPYGAFGPILRFDFQGLPQDMIVLFDDFFIDNSIYETTGGQSFEGVRLHCADPDTALVFEDFEDTLDGAVWRTSGQLLDDEVNPDNRCVYLEASAALGANDDVELLAAQALDGAQVDVWFRDLGLEEGALASDGRLTVYLYDAEEHVIGRCDQEYGSNLSARFYGQPSRPSEMNLYGLSGWHLLSVCYMRGETSIIRVFVDGVEVHNVTTDSDCGPFATMKLRCAGPAGWVKAAGYFDDIAIYEYAE